jgi:hypothetical protein
MTGCLASAFQGCRFNIGREQQGFDGSEGRAVRFLLPARDSVRQSQFIKMI